jgi:MFS family permease
VKNPFGGVGRAFANRAYRIYWIGQVPHVQGQWIYRVAAGWMMFDMTQSPAWLGATGFAMSAPALVLSPLAGALCDRIGHRRMSLIATATSGLIELATAALAYTGLMTPLLLFALVLLLAISTAFEFPARQSLVSVLLERSILTEGMALNWAVFNAAFFTGPLFAGLLLAAGGPPLAFAAVGAACLWMFGALARIPLVEMRQPRHAEAGGLLADVMSGIRYTLAHPVIPVVIALQVAASVLIRPYVDLMPGFAGAVFGRGEEGLATLLAGSGVGALLVSVSLTLFSRESWLPYTFVIGAACAGIALIAFAATDNYWLAVAVLLIVGGGTTATGIANATIIQQHVDPGYRGRVVSLNMAFQMGTPAFGSLALGWLAEFIGLQLAIGIAGVVFLACMTPFTRTLFRMPQPS